ncbi:MAG TPA: lasso peptide biosynthesis B2 protein [Solirubrobacterales bacterium]|nr:lasso peptide biosynthesis B2 protein [Solirubrobacterales bacterium]
MRATTPTDLDRLSPWAKARLSLEVMSTYLRVRWAMRGDDAEEAVRLIRKQAAGDPVEFDAEGEGLVAAWRLARATRKVLLNLPSDTRCLFRSLTLMSMLERRGIAQQLVIAVRPKPFAAHAWIEVEGQAVLSDADPGYERLLEI